MMVPESALVTVTPSAIGERWKRSVSACVVPAMTAVSNPNNRPPNAATTVLFKSEEFSVMTPVDGVLRGRFIPILRIEAARTPRELYWIRGAGQRTYFAETLGSFPGEDLERQFESVFHPDGSTRDLNRRD